MTLGLSLQNFTILHVVISLVAIVSGFIVLAGMLRAAAVPAWTAFFLTTTILTSVTGFMFPFAGITPAIIFGVISIAVLAVALVALYLQRLDGVWRWTYVVTALIALYLNVFVLIVQAFQKVPILQALAPTQAEPPFLVVQGLALALFLILGVIAVAKFRPGMPLPAKTRIA
jgi:hypothetical protein